MQDKKQASQTTQETPLAQQAISSPPQQYQLPPGIKFDGSYYYNDFGYWNEHNNFVMFEQLNQKFSMAITMYNELERNYNHKWSPVELNKYYEYIASMREYLITYLLKGFVNTQEQYQNAKFHYYNNLTEGYELYEKQFQYIGKKFGWFKQYKRQIPKVRQPEKEKLEVRPVDRKIDYEKVKLLDFVPQKYLNSTIFKKSNINIVFIGHVDSGKSTLTGNLLRQLNEVDEQDWIYNKQNVKANRMTSWELAGVSDVIPSEQLDGKTRQCAKLTFALENNRFTLFDAPGHKNYVPNMMMGACQADAAILIISAKEGEYESGFDKEGQTKEHAMLAKALGVYSLGVVVTKMSTVNWEEKRYNQIKSEVIPYLQSSCGFKDVIFIPVDSIQNLNIHTPHNIAWYKGPTFLDYLDHLKVPERTPKGPLRIPVIDKFKNEGILYIYGKIESGIIEEEYSVSLLPSRTQLVIKEIYNARDQRLPYAIAGENVKIRIKGIEELDIQRGDVVCNHDNYCQESSEFKAKLTVLELPEKNKILSSGFNCIIHMHAIAAQISIEKVQSKYDNEHKKFVPVNFLRSGEIGNVVMKVEKPLCMEKHDFMPSLGRFTLRDGNKTIGFGEITKLKPAKTLQKEQKDQLLLKKETKPQTQEGTKSTQAL